VAVISTLTPGIGDPAGSLTAPVTVPIEAWLPDEAMRATTDRTAANAMDRIEPPVSLNEEGRISCRRPWNPSSLITDPESLILESVIVESLLVESLVVESRGRIQRFGDWGLGIGDSRIRDSRIRDPGSAIGD
jgi:hypothetical protein